MPNTRFSRCAPLIARCRSAGVRPSSSGDTPAAWALAPVKSLTTAKCRLEGLLNRAECVRLAEEMARDVLMALHTAPDITGIAILGTEPRLSALASAVGAALHAEQDGEDYRAAPTRCCSPRPR